MLTPLKSALACSLPPEALYWLRSVKRAIMSEPPLPWPYGTETPPTGTNPPPEPVDDGRTIQDIALERYIARKLRSPDSYFDYEEVLLLPAEEIARTLSISVQYLNSAHVNGDIAEFGTMGGFTAKAIATAMVLDPQRQPINDRTAGENPFRILRLFDSFEGLPEITSPVDLNCPHVVTGAWSKGECKVLAAPELRARIQKIIPPHRFQIYEGWFADTVKTLPPETRFAMIHFDGDLYQSTIDALEPCFARGLISTGALLLFDDWNNNRALPTVGERRAWKELVNKFDIEASSGGDYGVASTKFIIHSYRGIPAEDD